MTDFLGHFLTACDDEIVADVSAAILAFLGYLAKRVSQAVTAYLATRQEAFVVETVVIAASSRRQWPVCSRHNPLPP